MSRGSSSETRCWSVPTSDDATAPASRTPSAGERRAQCADGDASRRRASVSDLETSRGAIEDRLGTDLDNVFPDDAGAPSRGAPSDSRRRLFGMGAARHRRRATTATTISKPSSQPCRRSPIISPSSWRWRSPIRSRRMIGQYLIDHDRRGRLPDRRSRRRRREARRDAGRRRGGARSPADFRSARRRRAQSHRMPRHPAQERDRFDPAMQALVGRLDLLAKRDLAALRRICGVDDDDLADMIAKSASSIPSRASPSARRGCSRSCRTSSCGRRRTAPSRRAQLRHAAEGPGQPALSRRLAAPRRTTATRPISPNACSPRPGSFARSTSAPRPSSRLPPKSSASRMRSSCTASASAPAQPEDRGRRHQHA